VGIGPWINYRDFWHKMDDAVKVATMWPAGPTFRADGLFRGVTDAGAGEEVFGEKKATF